jgi:glycosyltransferase involved in cell wall biosynthesis
MGGVETHCEELYPRLAKLRPEDEFTVVARRAYVSELYTSYEGIRIVSLPHIKGKHLETVTNTFNSLLYARFALGADVVHIHGIGPALLGPLAKALRMRVVVTVHSRNYDHAKWNRLERLVLRLGEVCAVVCADELIAISDWFADDLRQRFPRHASRIHSLPNGANHIYSDVSSDNSVRTLNRYRLQPGKYIIAVGRLVPEKGFHILLDAYSAAGLDCKLVILGDADHKDHYYQSLQARSSESVVFPGFLRRLHLRHLLENASLFVLPSYHEGLPIAALEALAAGAPVVLSDIRPNLELALPPDSYFTCGDTKALQAKLEKDHTTFRVEADTILRKYNWENVAIETAKIYTSLERPENTLKY